MQLSMDIIADELKDILQYARFPGSTGLTITSVRFLREQADARCSSTLYICRAAPGDIGSDDNLLILGEMPVDAPEGACVLAVREGLDADAVFNRVLDVFQKYQDWEQKLSLLLKCRAPLEDFLNVSQPILKSGIVLMDWDHNCVAVTRNVHMENTETSMVNLASNPARSVFGSAKASGQSTMPKEWASKSFCARSDASGERL